MVALRCLTHIGLPSFCRLRSVARTRSLWSGNGDPGAFIYVAAGSGFSLSATLRDHPCAFTPQAKSIIIPPPKMKRGHKSSTPKAILRVIVSIKECERRPSTCASSFFLGVIIDVDPVLPESHYETMALDANIQASTQRRRLAILVQ